ADAQRQLTRSQELFAQNFISQGAVATNQALVGSQKAVVASDRAAIEAARVGLSVSRIVAPSAGRAGAIGIFPGSSVQPGGAPQAAIVEGLRGKVVFVVEPGNKAGVRPVEVVTATGTEAVVTRLRAGERVVTDGRQNLRPGVAVIERAADAASGALRRGASA